MKANKGSKIQAPALAVFVPFELALAAERRAEPKRIAPLMTIHFAPAKGNGRTAHCTIINRLLSRVSLGVAANDNSRISRLSGAFIPPSDDVLNAALRHFGEYGLGAARAARMRAKQAFFEGDRAAYDWWLAITQTLDRRLANETLHVPVQTGIAANSQPTSYENTPESVG